MGEIANYSSNSDKAKVQAVQPTVQPPSKVRPVEVREVGTQKTNWFKEFIVGNPKDANRAVIRDVVFPAIKRTTVDVVQTFLTFLFDGGFSKKSNRGYDTMYRGGTTRSSTFTRDTAATSQESPSSVFVLYGTPERGDMELVRDVLLDLLERQGYITVRDYYDALGKSSNNVSYDNHYGWTDISATHVQYRAYDGLWYIVNLPKPKYLGLE